MTRPTPAQALGPVFAALGDVTRLQLMDRLAHGNPQSIVQLATGLELSHQGVAKHLKVLERAGLVRAQKVGRERQYVGDPQAVRRAGDYLQQIGVEWDAAIARLGEFVEGD